MKTIIDQDTHEIIPDENSYFDYANGVLSDATIDNLTFFQDVPLAKKSYMDDYKRKIANHQYNDGLKILRSRNIDYYGAWIVNLLFNKILATQDCYNSINRNILISTDGTIPPSGFNLVGRN